MNKPKLYTKEQVYHSMVRVLNDPGSKPGECTGGTAATFEEARSAFEAAWRVFLAKRTEADFQAWRDHRAWTARKYAAWLAT